MLVRTYLYRRTDGYIDRRTDGRTDGYVKQNTRTILPVRMCAHAAGSRCTGMFDAGSWSMFHVRSES